MSGENVKVVRAVYDAVAGRDAATVLALYDPEVVWDDSRLPEAALTGRSVSRGHEGLRSVFREWDEAWETFEDDCEDLIDAGEYVLSVVTRRGRGRASGAEASTRRGGVWTIRAGKVVRVVWFPSVEEAFEAVGCEGAVDASSNPFTAGGAGIRGLVPSGGDADRDARLPHPERAKRGPTRQRHR